MAIGRRLLIDCRGESCCQVAAVGMHSIRLVSIRNGELIISLIALLLYETVVTFDREVNSVWKRRTSIASWIFLLNRYLVSALYLVNIAMYFETNARVSGTVSSLNIHRY